MNNTEIKANLLVLSDLTSALEGEYIENEGEVTESTESKETEIAVIRELLAGEGIDSLGRWLKSKEDEKKALKAEKDYLTRRIAACDATTDYIKVMVGQVLRATGQDKVKGTNGYAFSQYTSVKTTADKTTLKALYEERVRNLLVKGGIPAYIGVSLTASSTIFAEEGEQSEGDAAIFVTTRQDTCKFTKPRASVKEEE